MVHNYAETSLDCFEDRIAAALKQGRVGLCSSVLEDSIQKVGGSGSISSDPEMSAFLDALLDEVLPKFCPAFQRVSGPVGPQRKWRYSSAYQKAVRRGDPSIKAVAAALNTCDAAYIWRRAPTIALEDVGMGDPWVCALVLHACRFAKIRNKHGKDVIAGFVGELMGSAVKDRLSCDSFCLPYLHPELSAVREAVDQMVNTERAELYGSDETPFALRVAAGMALAGPRYGGDVFTSIGGSPDALAEAVQGLVPYPIQWISRQYAKMAKDGMFVALPLVWRQLVSEGQAQVVKSELPRRQLIDGIMSATFDGYTPEGGSFIFRKSVRAGTEIAGGHAEPGEGNQLSCFYGR
jgi:hypothetical protein